MWKQALTLLLTSSLILRNSRVEILVNFTNSIFLVLTKQKQVIDK